jgi:Rieske Fe-S protein
LEPQHAGNETPHLPPPSLWPVGFALGIACILLGLVETWWAVVAGGILAIVFGFLWVRDLGAGRHTVPAPADHAPPEAGLESAAPVPAHVGEAAMPAPAPGERFSRSRFLEASTLGLGAVIGGVVTVPAVGLMVAPAFSKQHKVDVDLGPISNFNEGQYYITTFLEDPQAGDVSRRTAYIRYNGVYKSEPSFTILSNRCAHLGCPVQPNGPIDSQHAKEVNLGKNGSVSLTPVQPAGFGCPCHGGQYDTEGNRTAGPPVRGLDRFNYSIRNGKLFLGSPYSVGTVKGEGATAVVREFELHGPGQHVDDWEFWLYPGQPPH